MFYAAFLWEFKNGLFKRQNFEGLPVFSPTYFSLIQKEKMAVKEFVLHTAPNF